MPSLGLGTGLLARRALLRPHVLALQGSRLIHGLPEPIAPGEFTPVYPEIPQEENGMEREQKILAKKLQDMKTVEEKQYYLNQPKYYGWYSTMVDTHGMPYGVEDFAQMATWTHLVRDDKLPKAYEAGEARAKEMAKELAPRLKQFVTTVPSSELLSHDHTNDKAPYSQSHFTPLTDEHIKVRVSRQTQLLRGINRLITQQLQSTEEGKYLLATSVDQHARNEGFWFRAGFDPDRSMIKKRQGLMKAQQKPTKFIRFNKDNPMTEERVYEKMDNCIQVEGKTMMQLRHAKAIPALWDVQDELCRQYDQIPTPSVDPRTYGFKKRTQHGTNLPGHWACSDSRHSNLLYISMDQRKLQLIKHDETEGMMESKLVFGAYASMLAQSMQFGASPLNDPERPLATQVVATDGRMFKLSAFQLNKTALHVEPTEDDLNNVCWLLPSAELFSADTGSINEDVLSNLLSFYLNTPREVVPASCGVVSDVIQDDYSREYFHNQFRHLYSKREKALEKPSIENWQKVMMIDNPSVGFPQMFMRERPWFKMARICFRGKEQWHPEFKKLDSYKSKYQPVAFRSNLKDPKQKQVKKVVAPIVDSSE